MPCMIIKFVQGTNCLLYTSESYEYKGISEEGTIIVEKIKEAKKSYKVVIKVK